MASVLCQLNYDAHDQDQLVEGYKLDYIQFSLGSEFSSQRSFSHSITLKHTPVSVLLGC